MNSSDNFDEENFEEILKFTDEGNLEEILKFTDEENLEEILKLSTDEDSELWISEQFEHDRHQYIDNEEFQTNLDVTVKDVANWMLNQVLSKGELHQKDAALHINQYFGKKFVYQNKNNNLAISREILIEFLRISSINVVWIPKFFKWRLRQKGDPSTRKVYE